MATFSPGSLAQLQRGPQVTPPNPRTTLPFMQAPAGAPQPTSQQSMFTPSYVTDMFGGGIPTSSPAQVGGIPGIDPTALTQQILKSLAPQFAQQNHGLTEALANAGIVGGSTGGAMAQLGLQQQSQAQGDIQPLIMQALQANQGTALNAGEFNAGQQNQVQQFDIGNMIRAAMGNSQDYNQMAQMYGGMQNQDWLSQLGAATNLSTAGAGAQASSFNPIYQPPANVGGGFMQLAGQMLGGGK